MLQYKICWKGNLVKFLPSLSGNLVNNLTEEIHKTKCKYGNDDY